MRLETYHHGNLMPHLIKNAISLIEGMGIENVSLRHVAANCGVSPTAVYRHFVNKEALLLACATEGFRRLAETMAEKSAPRHDDVRQRLIQLGLGYLTFAYSHKNLYSFMFSADLSQASAEQTEVFLQSYTMLLETSAEGVEKGVFRGSVDTVACKAWSLVHGLATLVIAKRIPAESMDEFLHMARDIFAGTIE